ncbi:phage portal protein [Enterovirga rhinocerotis]|uniref:HK97 family phage portal protein n=1 Tax=Enterovirga rhinocerotis TaxID=1339210 RepID=A0A4R7BTX8_9HYPH|nr:phage portal protein [Enterovirga rhinocerotis]TDR88951.1 HK97 family phage portal protein [Enterovirga rhinocerotis]
MPHPILSWLGLAGARPPPGSEAKAAPPLGGSLAVYMTGRPVWTERDYAALAREGFQRNAVVHRAVRLVAESAASIPLTLTRDGRELADHPIASLLLRPNARESGTRFLEGAYGHLLISGNAYLHASALEGEPRELHNLRPDRMQVVAGEDGWPVAYDYRAGSRTLRFDQAGQGPPPILHLTLFHPLDDHYGLSPMEAAAVALDIHNAAGAWNKALLDNAARPSGALVFVGPAGTALSDAQFDRLKGELETSYQGAANAGRPLLLEGGLDWKPLSLSPKDMDFIEAKNGAAREIALAFGVPPLLLGLPGDNTYANYAEANRSFYRQTVIPLVRRTAEAVVQWLGPAFGDGFRLEPDLDAIEALALERESLWRRLGAASFLDDDERREAVGYGRRAPRTDPHPSGEPT